MLDSSVSATDEGPSPMQNLAPIPELYVSADSAQKLKIEAGSLLSHDLTPR